MNNTHVRPAGTPPEDRYPISHQNDVKENTSVRLKIE